MIFDDDAVRQIWLNLILLVFWKGKMWQGEEENLMQVFDIDPEFVVFWEITCGLFFRMIHCCISIIIRNWLLT